MKREIRLDKATLLAHCVATKARLDASTEPIDLSDIPEAPAGSLRGLPRGLRYEPKPEFIVVTVESEAVAAA